MATPPTSKVPAPDGKVGVTPDPGEAAAPGLVWLGARIPAEIKQKIVDTAETCKVSQQEVITRALEASLGGEETAEMLTLECPRLHLSIPPGAVGVRITIEGPTGYAVVTADSAAGPEAASPAEPTPDPEEPEPAGQPAA